MAERELKVVIRAKDLYSKVMTRAQRSARAVTKAWTIMGNVWKKVRKIALLVTAAIAGLSYGMLKLVSSTAKAGDEFQKMALRTGMTAQALSEFKHAAEISGTTIETFEKGMKTLSKRISDARFGLQSYVRIFETLGIAYQETNGELREADDVFMDIIGAINSLGSETEKAALAQELLGKAGTQLLPMIKAGTTEISKLREEARRLGITFDDVAANQSAEYVDAMTRLKTSLRGVFNVIGKDLIPVFTLWATTATDKIKELLADGTVDRWARQILGAVEKIGKGIHTLGKAFGIFMRFFGVETRSALEVVNTEIERMEKAQRAGILRLNDASVAAKIYNDLLAERNRLENDSLATKKKMYIIDLDLPVGGGESPRLIALRANLDAEFQIWEFFSNRKQRLSEREAVTLQGNARGHMLLETFRGQVVGRAYRGMEDAILGLLDTGKMSARAFLKVMTDQVKVELLGIAIRAGVQGVYQYARGLAAAASFNPMAALHFASSKTFFKTAALAGAGAVAVHGIGASLGGGTTERAAAGTAGGEPVRVAGVPTRELAQAQQAQQITLNIYNPLTGQIADEIGEEVIALINRTGERNYKIDANVIEAA